MVRCITIKVVLKSGLSLSNYVDHLDNKNIELYVLIRNKILKTNVYNIQMSK